MPRLPLLAQRTEEFAHIIDQQPRSFQGGEMATAVELRPMHNVVAAFCITAYSDILSEDSHSSGDAARLLVPGGSMHVLVVQLRGGTSRLGEPVEHHVGENDITIDGKLGKLQR